MFSHVSFARFAGKDWLWLTFGKKFQMWHARHFSVASYSKYYPGEFISLSSSGEVASVETCGTCMAECACLSSLGCMQVYFLVLCVSSTALAGRLGPCRLCRFDGKPDLLAELAEAAAIFNLSIMMTEGRAGKQLPKEFCCAFSRVAVSLGKVPGLARQRWEMYRAGFGCWSLIGLHVRCVMLVSSFVGVTGARYSWQVHGSTHTIHVGNIYIHLVDSYGKCK